MTGRPSPIQTLFSRALDSCLGRSRLRSVAAKLGSDEAPSGDDTPGAAGATGILVLAGRRGKFTVAGMAPSLTKQVCKVRRLKRECGEGQERELGGGGRVKRGGGEKKGGRMGD